MREHALLHKCGNAHHSKYKAMAVRQKEYSKSLATHPLTD
jgi:hypothetical protein